MNSFDFGVKIQSLIAFEFLKMGKLLILGAKIQIYSVEFCNFWRENSKV